MMCLEADVEQRLHEAGLERDGGGLVQWQKRAPQHPRNWNPSAKIWNVLLVTWLEFYMTAISASGVCAATAREASIEYEMPLTLGYFAFFTVYLVAQTISGLFGSPISEFLGRRSMYIVATAVFCVSSIVVAATPSSSSVGIYFGRCFQGVAAAIPATVAYGNFEDMYNSTHRIWVIYAYTFWATASLAVGPIYAAYVVRSCGWRWVYWISAVTSLISAVACFTIRESNSEQLLEVAVRRINHDLQNVKLETSVSTSRGNMTFASFTKNNLVFPARLFVSEPIIFFCAALCAIAWSLVYGLTEALVIVYTLPPFNTFDMVSSNLSFTAFMIGQAFNILPRIYDFYLLRRYRQQKRRIQPETKITSIVVSCPVMALGLWLFAWSIPPLVTVPWVVSMIGLCGVGYATNDFSYVIFGYATDSYGARAASAVSAISITRTLSAAILPLVTTQMYEGLGANKAATIFAVIATVFCITPWLFLTYGEKLRRQSKFCTQGDEVLALENEHMKSEHQ